MVSGGAAGFSTECWGGWFQRRGRGGRFQHRALGRPISAQRLRDTEKDEKTKDRELQITKEVFLQVLQGVHHPRIQYPESAQVPLPKGATQPDILPEGLEGGAVNGTNGKGSAYPVPGGMEEPAGV